MTTVRCCAGDDALPKHNLTKYHLFMVIFAIVHKWWLKHNWSGWIFCHGVKLSSVYISFSTGTCSQWRVVIWMKRNKQQMPYDLNCLLQSGYATRRHNFPLCHTIIRSSLLCLCKKYLFVVENCTSLRILHVYKATILPCLFSSDFVVRHLTTWKRFKRHQIL